MEFQKMKNEKNWTAMAEDFDERQNYVVGDNSNTIIEQELLKLKNLQNTLELGCGNGRYTKLLATVTNKIIATDVDEKMINTATEKLKNTENITFEVADCYQTSYNNNHFDTVFMGNLIHVVLEPQIALLESRRILKKGGKLILLSFTIDGMTKANIEGLKKRYIEKFGEFPEINKPMLLKDLAELVSSHGFKIKEQKLLGAESKAMYLIAEK